MLVHFHAGKKSLVFESLIWRKPQLSFRFPLINLRPLPVREDV